MGNKHKNSTDDDPQYSYQRLPEDRLHIKKIVVTACTLAEGLPLYIADSTCEIYTFPSPIIFNPITHKRLVSLTNPGSNITITHDVENRVHYVETIPINWTSSEKQKQQKRSETEFEL